VAAIDEIENVGDFHGRDAPLPMGDSNVIVFSRHDRTRSGQPHLACRQRRRKTQGLSVFTEWKQSTISAAMATLRRLQSSRVSWTVRGHAETHASMKSAEKKRLY
ncbi:MAG: hypothetical protein OXQ84_11615, partial [bacterium]|nr:hypothetical protein [bacterium]